MFEMIFIWTLAALSDGRFDVCSSSLQGRPPTIAEISRVGLDAAETGSGDGFSVRMINDHKVMVVSHHLDLPDLDINGGTSSFSWGSVNGVSALVLERCGLARSALSLRAGSVYGEWIGPDFFDARPNAGTEASSLRTISFFSEALGQDREIYLVVGEGWNGANGDPLLVSGDGLAGGPFGAIAETLSNGNHARPIAFASARFGEGTLDGTKVPVRAAEYHLPDGSAPEARRTAYAAHEKFFFDEFLPFVIDELGGKSGPVYTFGISSSASFALEQALMRGETIQGVIAASPPIHSRTRELANRITTRQTIRLWCGTLEEIFCTPIRNLAEAHDYPLQTRHAAHLSALWEEALAASIIELFPARN